MEDWATAPAGFAHRASALGRDGQPEGSEPVTHLGPHPARRLGDGWIRSRGFSVVRVSAASNARTEALMRMWRGPLVTALTVSLLGACASQPVVSTPRTYQGAGVGAGALIDKDNRWRGAALGAGLGGVLGGSLTEISSRAARESVASNHPVAYQSTDGWQRVEAAPQESGSPSRCRQVRERVYQDNQLVREQIREVC
jgi:hypothetical protein